MQTLEISGEPHATDDGEYIVLVDNIDHKLHIFEVRLRLCCTYLTTADAVLLIHHVAFETAISGKTAFF